MKVKSIFLIAVLVMAILGGVIGCDTECSQSQASISNEESGTTSDPTPTPADTTHKIIYNNIKNAAAPTKVLFDETEDVSLSNISITGYTFDGWYDASTDGTKVTGWNAGDRTADVTLWARWTANSYKIVFDKNGGSGEMSNIDMTYDVSESLPTCLFTAQTGYKFASWNTAADGKGTTYPQNANVKNLASEQNVSVTLYAQWIDKDAHGIIYNNIKNANNSANPQSFKENQSITLTDLSKTGYTFNGWYDASTDGTKVTGWNAGDRTADVTLWARWTANSYTITYTDMENADFSGVHGSAYPTSHTYGTATELAVPTKTGYDFGGWYTDSNCSENVITEIGATQITADVTLYAKWTLHNYTITYHNVNDATNDNVSSFTVEDNVSLTNIARRGYTFDGWYEVNVDVTADVSTDGWSAGERTANVTLWAKWTPITYTITYKDQSGDEFSGVHGSDYPTTHTYDTETALVVPTKDGFVFVGWHMRSDCSDNTIDTIGATQITSDITLYAKWIYGCSASELAGLLATLDSSIGPYTIRITDESPTLSTIKTALTDNNSIKVDLDLSQCTGLTSIGASAFVSCSGLTSVTIPDSVTSIAYRAFSWCSGLTSITIPDSVESIGEYAFNDCVRLTSVTIPNSVTSIGHGAFGGCSGLTSVTIPDSVTSIGEHAFTNCSGLTSVTIPDSVTSIGAKAFRFCRRLTSVTIPDSVTSIGVWTFEDCSGLTSVTIPDSVTSIGQYAFRDCSGLTSVTIPDSVTSIGNYAFNGCSGLTTLTVKATDPPSFGSYMLSGCSALTKIYVPSGSVDAYKAETGWSSFADKIQAITE